MKKVVYRKSALKTLQRLPANTSRRIRQKIDAYAAGPESQSNNVITMQGSTSIRLRVGDWRVIMDDQGNVVMIEKIGPRGSVYKR